MGWTAVVLAGSRPGPDAFAAQHGTDLKALIPIGGMPMVRRPVEALLASERVSRVRVLAQQPERIAAVLPADPRLSVEASGATIAATLEAMCFDPAVEWPLLVTTADHALLDKSMVEEFGSRTWIRFRGGAYSGANLFALGSPKVLPALELWRSVEQDRKKVLSLLWGIGPLTFLGAVLRLRTLDQTLRRIGRKLGIDIRAVELANPLAAVDVDKPADHVLVETILEGRA
jgi:MobA-like NTP transferase protein